MNANVNIRPAKKADIDGMSRLLSQLFSIESDFVPDEEKSKLDCNYCWILWRHMFW
jgi:hypothetical protein